MLMLNPDILKRRFLSSPLVQFCTALLLFLMLSAASASAQATNVLPIADADTSPILTFPFHVAGGVTITLDGSGSSDPDGDNDNLTYAWTKFPGTSVILSDATAQNPTFTTPARMDADQNLNFQLVVTDEAGGVSTPDLISIIVPSSSTTLLPTVAAGPPQTVDEGATVILEARISGFEEDSVIYIWGPADPNDLAFADIDLEISGRNIYMFTAPTGLLTDRVLMFRVMAQTPTGESATGFVTITVSARATEPDDDTIEKTVDTINRFMHTRTNLILANQPKRDRRINRLQRGVGSEQLSFATGEITKLKPFEFNFLSLGSGNYKFATSLDQVTRAADHLQVMQGDVGGLTATGMNATHERRRFDVWFEASFNKFNGSADSGGDFAIAYLGADYLVSPDLLFGALVQYDRLSDSSTSENYKIEGKGWMVGPYVTARLQDNLYLDARLAWGTSDNDISPPDSDYTDSFKSTRRLANISLSGEFTQGQWTIRPNASLSYMADKQGAYTNTSGDTIPSQTVSSGQLRLGPNFSTQFLGDNGWIYEPSFTLDAIYSHASTSGGLSTTPSPQDGWRARMEAGLAMTLSEKTRLSFTGNYDGIGQSGFEAWGLGLNLDMKF